MIKANCKQFEEVGIAQKLDVSRPANKRIEVSLLDVEDYVDPTDLRCFHFAQQVINHLTNYLFLGVVFEDLLKNETVFL